MKVSWAQFSTTGPVRTRNEDSCLLWEPEKPEDRLAKGQLAAIADGIGSGTAGDEASRLATETTLKIFQNAPQAVSPQQVLNQAVREAALAVHEASHARDGRMGTTLTAAVL